MACDTKCNINCKKVLVGGLAAGLVMNGVEFVAHQIILGPRYMGLAKMGYVYSQPQLPFFPVYNLIIFACGILLALLYAAARDGLGAGPKTAIMIGLVVGFIAGVPSNYSSATWYGTGKFIPFITMIAVFIESVVGTLIAGAVYKPKEITAA